MYTHIAIELDTKQEDAATKVFWPLQIQGTGRLFSSSLMFVKCFTLLLLINYIHVSTYACIIVGTLNKGHPGDIVSVLYSEVSWYT